LSPLYDRTEERVAWTKNHLIRFVSARLDRHRPRPPAAHPPPFATSVNSAWITSKSHGCKAFASATRCALRSKLLAKRTTSARVFTRRISSTSTARPKNRSEGRRVGKDYHTSC